MGIIVLIAHISFAQVIQTNAKANSSVDMERLARIDELVNGYISKNWLTGAVRALLNEQEIGIAA